MSGLNWCGSYAYRAGRLHRPASVEAMQEIVAATPRLRVLGSRDSFTAIADSAELLAALAPFGARPHWGKLFLADAAVIAPLYERLPDFARLVERLDPRGAFRNDWLERRVVGR